MFRIIDWERVVATAAHCIADWGGGSSGLATSVYFIPAATKNNTYGSSAGPIGSKSARLCYPNCYINGTCVNTSSGVLSSNDVALVVLAGEVSNLPYTRQEHMDLDGMVMVLQLVIH